MFLQINQLAKHYQKGQTLITALDDVSLNVDQGEFIALTGPSGSGKTTLLNIIGGLDVQDSGSVLIGGQPQIRGNDRESSAWRAQNVGFVFQFSNLLPFLTAAQNVELPLLLTSLSTKERASRVSAALELVGLAERAGHKPAELSGGQEQRVAIARAFVSAPKLMLCDEPTGDLDRKSAQSILELLNTLKSEFNKTIIMVTHDMEAAAATDRQVVLDKGKLRLAGQPLPDGTFKAAGVR
ncbi:ABC transporter ATP-binding protein [Rheinheimera riviphila]|uniref:ABC transporter ATP-binding protein n=1 Tax=Rheinheimera riviphila TaxID=1834037 RepID=A0A437R5A9_9GAMM|nr:ABC transporter ATP-binding protein [Rheinheimera riviphila]RVU41966.1 ABC transporter ATP-binding protein [Rheinheimera riviphila]